MPLLLPTMRALGLSLSLTTAAIFSISHLPPSRLLQCESPLSSSSSAGGGGRGSSGGSGGGYFREQVVGKRGLNPAVLKQVSSGSLLGLLGGVAVRTFSKTLALVFGILVYVIQFAASKGYNIIPTARIHRYVKGINLRSVVEDNVAFKLSFGTTFMLAALARFQ